MKDIASLTLGQKEFNLFREMIYNAAGISLGAGKQQLVESRLSKRLRACGIGSFAGYYNYLQSEDRDGEERLKMINALTTNKTDFFREQHHFDYLRSHVFPMLEQRAKETGQRRIRIWSAACSTGEEPYTLAMTVLDHFGPTSFHGWDIRILASDVDTDVLAHAEKGCYAADRVADLPKDVLKRHFLKTSRDPEAPVQVRPELQELITFRRINFIESNWPIHTTFNVIFCRNVMIYFDEPTQDRLLTRFSERLDPDGHLFIGHSESILRLDNIYRSLGNTIYTLKSAVKADSNTSPGTGRHPAKHSAAAGSGGRRNGARGTTSAEAPARASIGVGNPVRPLHAATATHVQSNSPECKLRMAPATKRSTELRIPVYSIIVGELKASFEPAKVTTLLGSCVGVCLYDPKTKIGGMNHFMLPSNSSSDPVSATYGVHAMELLINEIMKLGGDRRRLTAKVFGGGFVIGHQSPEASRTAIGDQNIQFALNFLETDSIPVVAKDVGGTMGRQIQFLTHTGQAFVRHVQKVEEITDVDWEQHRRKRRRPTPEIDLSAILF
jgi:chemotaxis protein methyltransferase CheR